MARRAAQAPVHRPAPQVNRDALSLIGEQVRWGAILPLEGSLMQVKVNPLEASQRILTSRVEMLALQLKALAGLPPEAPLAVRAKLGPPGPTSCPPGPIWP